MQDYGPDAAILGLTANRDTVYGTDYGFRGGNFEGVFAAEDTGGRVRWLQDCHGDTYGVAPVGDVIYSVGPHPPLQQHRRPREFDPRSGPLTGPTRSPVRWSASPTPDSRSRAPTRVARVSTETEAGHYVAEGGDFERDTDYVATRITRDGRDGYPVEAGRYRLVVARACPWANRAVIVRRLLGLESAISMGMCGPTHDSRSWTFDLDPGGVDPVLGYERLQQTYFARDPGYQKGITVPALVEVATKKLVTNEYRQMTLDFSTEWTEFHRDGAPELYPERLRDEIDEVSALVYEDVNNGVYRCGFAGTQEAYEQAYDTLFTRLDWLSERLGEQRFLVGDTITEADVRLFTTLARFDAVYHNHFKTNQRKLTEMPVLWAYARDLFQTPGFGDTTDFVQIKQHYYLVHTDLNPTGVVPKGPYLRSWLSPHGRDQLGGRAFGDGTPPGPPPPPEVVPREHSAAYAG